MARKTPVPTGAAHRKKHGLKPVSCDLTPDEYEQVRQAAFALELSKAAFVRRAAAELARTVLSGKSRK